MKICFRQREEGRDGHQIYVDIRKGIYIELDPRLIPGKYWNLVYLCKENVK